MGKLLSWIVLFAIGWLVYKFFVISARKAERAATEGSDARRPDPKALGGEAIVPCAHCGVYVPTSEALVAGGEHFCSAAHRDAGPRG